MRSAAWRFRSRDNRPAWARGMRPWADVLEARALLAITNLTGVALPLHAISDPLTNVPLATFTDTSGAKHVANIEWGDGDYPNFPDISVATIVETPGQGGTSTYSVEGSHIYSVTGDLNIHINVLGGGESLWTGTTVTNVSGFNGTRVTGLTGVELVGVPVAALTYNRGFTLGQTTFFFGPQNYFAAIDWGDGGESTGAIQFSSGGPGGRTILSILGSHTYAEAGTYTVTINAIGGVGQSIWTSTTATITDPVATPGALPFATTAGSALTDQSLAGLTAPTGTSLTAAVDWGDGTAPTFAKVVAAATPAASTPGGGPTTTTYTVEGSHTYQAPGTHKVTVNVIEPGGKSLWTSAMATVYKGLAPVDGATVSGAAGGSLTGVPFGSFVGPAGTTYYAAISWGDGTAPGFATVVSTSTPGSFRVLGSHKYAAPGTYTAWVNVVEADGESVWGAAKVTIG